MLPRFFIDRPIFAWVIAIIIMLAGGLAIFKLPVSQYPAIAPPQIAINATYPGASAKTVEDTVTQVIEQKMNGIDRLRYMSSSSDSTGAVSIVLTFDAGTDPNIAQVQVQNKLQLAMPLLPQKVQQQGIQVVKSTRNYLMIVGLVSQDGKMSRHDLSDYLAANVQEPISRVTGVGEVTLFGSQYAMRIWLDPNRLSSYGLTPADVRAAVQAQNAQVSAGQLGGAPFTAGQQITASITAQSLLKTPEEFDDILVRTNPDGSVVRLRDVARSEIGTEIYGMESWYNGKPASGVAIRLASGANALETADAVKKKVEELSKFFPAGVKTIYPYDTTPFVRVSIEEVIKTLAEAILLVIVVMYLFLQNFRATLIPAIAVPVVLLGTFGVLAAAAHQCHLQVGFAQIVGHHDPLQLAGRVAQDVRHVVAGDAEGPRDLGLAAHASQRAFICGKDAAGRSALGALRNFPADVGDDPDALFGLRWAQELPHRGRGGPARHRPARRDPPGRPQLSLPKCAGEDHGNGGKRGIFALWSPDIPRTGGAGECEVQRFDPALQPGWLGSRSSRLGAA